MKAQGEVAVLNIYNDESNRFRFLRRLMWGGGGSLNATLIIHY